MIGNSASGVSSIGPEGDRGSPGESCDATGSAEVDESPSDGPPEAAGGEGSSDDKSTAYTGGT